MVTVANCLDLPDLSACKVIAGQQGLSRLVKLAHVIDLSDMTPWADAHMLILTTGQQLSGYPTWPRLIERLDQQPVAGLLCALGPYMVSLPDEAIAAAEAHQFPLITVPWSQPFMRISESIHALVISSYLDKLQRLQQWQYQFARQAVHSRSLSDFLREVSSALQTPLVLEDSAGHCLISAGQFDPPAARVPVLSADDVVYYLSFPAQIRSDPYRYQALEHAALLAAMRLMKNQVKSDTERRLRSSLFDALLEGTAPTAGLSVKRADLLGLHPDTPYSLLVLSKEEPQEDFDPLQEDQHHQWLSTALKSFNPVVTASGRFWAVALKPPRPNLSELESALAEWRRKFSWTRGVLSEPLILQDTARTFDSLRHLCEFAPTGHVTPAQDLLFYRALQSLPAPVMEEFFRLTWQKIDDAALRTTLQQLIAYRGSLTGAARSLGIHRNTLRSRISRLETCLQRPLTNELLSQLELTWSWHHLHALSSESLSD